MWNGKEVAVKKFDPMFISFSMQDFYKEIALQW